MDLAFSFATLNTDVVGWLEHAKREGHWARIKEDQ
jgi:hypothetical protein